MAYTDNVIAVARETQLFIGLETTPGTLIAVDSCSMALLSGAGSVQQSIRHIEDPQFRNTRSKLEPTPGSFDVGQYTFPCLLKSIAAAGVAEPPEIDVFLRCLFGEPATTDTVRRYSLKGVDPGGTVYPSFSAWFKVGHTVHYISGATVNQAEFEIMGDDLVKVTFSGEFMRRGWVGTAGGASIDTNKYFFPDAADSAKVQTWNPADGTYGSPATISSASLPSAPGGSLLLVPYMPTNGVEIGLPLYGKYGLCTVDGDPFLINSARITFANGIKYLPNVKDNKLYPDTYIVPATRQISGSINRFMYRDTPLYDYKALQDPINTDSLVIPCTDRSDTAGRKITFNFPKVIWSSPAGSGEEEKSTELAFSAVASTDYDDEFFMDYNPT